MRHTPAYKRVGRRVGWRCAGAGHCSDHATDRQPVARAASGRENGIAANLQRITFGHFAAAG